MNRRFLRALILGNLAVYTAAALLAAYFYASPATSTTAASADQASTGGRPFLSLILPTPTRFAEKPGAPAITPTAVKTATASASQSGSGASKTSPVKDRALVPASSLNILIMGTDRRPGQVNWRTDTLILVTVNQETKSVGMLSIPRDLWVQIPGIGPQRINTADFYGEYYHLPGGGPETIKRTIEQNLGIRVHYYARVGFDAFRQAIDTLGGIDVDVDCPLVEYSFYDDYGRADLNFQPGLQRMDGITALRYARSRYTTNDYDRSRRQRKVLLAMWDKALSLNLLPRWPELYRQFSDSVQTDLGPVEMAGLAFIGSQLRMDRIKSRAIDNRVTTPWTSPAGEMVLLPQPEKIHAVLVDLFSESAPGADPFETEGARIRLTSGNEQALSTTAVALKRQGFNIAETSTVNTLAARSSVTVFNPKPATVERLLGALRLGPDAVQTASAASSNVDIEVYLGRDYNSCQK